MTSRTRGWIIGLAVLNGFLAIALVVTIMLGASSPTDDEPAGDEATATGSSEAAPATVPDDGDVAPTPEPADTATEEEALQLAPPPDGALDVPAFALPSRNIACSLDEGAVTCTIADATFAPPAGQECEWRGQIVSLGIDGVAMPCPDAAASPASDDLPTLEYGQSTAIGQWACTSSERGVECFSLADGTGFTLARAGFTSYGPGRLA